MIEGLRAELPELARLGARLRRPSVARETTAWAFVSASGAALIAGAVVSLLVGGWLFPAVFPPTREHPSWLTSSAIATAAALIAAGAVALRAGGVAAVLVYAGYQLLRSLVALPGRLVFCERGGGLTAPGQPCDVASILLARWPELAALVLGAIAARSLLAVGGGRENRMLRGAGAFGLTVAILSTALGVALVGASPSGPLWPAVLVILIYALAGLVGGVVLAPASLARTVVVALLVSAPQVALVLPLLLTQIQQSMPAEMAAAQLAQLAAPPLGAALLFVARAYARRAAGP